MVSRKQILQMSCGALLAFCVGCDFDTPSRAGSGHVPNPPLPPMSKAAAEAEESLERGNAAWEAVVSQAQPAPQPADWTNNPPSAEVMAAWEESNARRALKAADMTREFGVSFPEHPMAEKLDSLELKFLQIAAEHGIFEREDRMLELLKRMGGDGPEKVFQLRMESALRAAMARKRSESSEAMVVELEKRARELMKEYPGRGEVYDLLLAVAENCEIRKGVGIVDEILGSNASEATKAAAEKLKAKGEAALKDLAVKEVEQAERLRQEAAKRGETNAPSATVASSAPALKFDSPEMIRADPVGKRLELKFTASDGREIDLAKLQGKVVLIDFWASWCGPCIEEIPVLREAYAKHKGAGFEILGLSLDTKKLPYQRAVGEEKIVWPTAYDHDGWIEKLTNALGIEEIPMMWLIDRQGIIRNVKAHEDPAGAIEAAMAEK